MQQLQLKRIRFSREADSWLKVLKSRTGITPNVLCRLALTLSLAEPGSPVNAKYPEDSEREINRYTLLGEYEVVFAALLRQRAVKDGVDSSIDEQFRAHMHRGIMLLQTRLKSVSDLAGLVTSGRARSPSGAGGSSRGRSAASSSG